LFDSCYIHGYRAVRIDHTLVRADHRLRHHCGRCAGSGPRKAAGLPKETSVDLALIGVPAAIICARLYFVIFSWDLYAGNPISILYIWEGGMAIYGGIIGAVIAGAVYARKKKLSFLKLADLAAPCIALGQSIGRWGNFVNQEAYGRAVENAALHFFPVSVFIERSQAWHYATFFYESAWCALIVAILLVMERRNLFRRAGDAFFTYIFLYGLERAFVEGLRTDSLYIGPVRVSQALSLLLMLFACCILFSRLRAQKKTALPMLLSAAAAAALIILGHPAIALVPGILAPILALASYSTDKQNLPTDK